MMRIARMTPLLVAGVLWAYQAGERPPQQAIESFYREVQRVRPSGLPTAEQAAALSVYWSVGLQAAIRRAVAEQDRCRRAHPDEVPPWVDGDLFSSNAEGFTSMVPGAADEQGRYALRFTYVEKDVRLAWQDAVTVRQEGGRWVIDDVHYRKSNGYTSGYGSSLRKSLAGRGCAR